MSFLSWTVPVVWAHEVMSSTSLEPPPVKMLSPAPVTSLMNAEANAPDDPPTTDSQSSPVVALSAALPSSSNLSGRSAANVDAGAANDAYCRSSEHKYSAVHSRVKPFRVRALTMNQSPRDI